MITASLLPTNQDTVTMSDVTNSIFVKMYMSTDTELEGTYFVEKGSEKDITIYVASERFSIDSSFYVLFKKYSPNIGLEVRFPAEAEGTYEYRKFTAQPGIWQ